MTRSYAERLKVEHKRYGGAYDLPRHSRLGCVFSIYPSSSAGAGASREGEEEGARQGQEEMGW